MKKKLSCIVIFILCVVILISLIKNHIWNRLFSTQEIQEIYSIIIFLTFSISYSISSFFIIPILKLLEKIDILLIEKKHSTIQLDYYRDIINNYSIGTLSCCYGKKIDYKDQIVATLLKLELDGKIKIMDNQLEILSEENLSYSEQMLIKSLRGVKTYTNKHIKQLLQEDNITDCKESDLFLHKKSFVDQLLSTCLCFNLLLFFLNIFWILLLNNFIEQTMSYEHEWLILPLFIYSFTLVFISVFICNKEKTILIKNEKGMETQKKLIGLYHYLKDYSRINERQITEINLWDYYIVYAILFNLKGNLNKEAHDLYVKYLEIL